MKEDLASVTEVDQHLMALSNPAGCGKERFE